MYRKKKIEYMRRIRSGETAVYDEIPWYYRWDIDIALATCLAGHQEVLVLNLYKFHPSQALLKYECIFWSLQHNSGKVIGHA